MLRPLLGCVLPGLLAIPALAHEGLVCGRPEVLSMVFSTLLTQGSTERIVANAVGEAPTSSPALTRCSIRLLGWHYDTARFGLQPVYSERVYEFTVRRGRNVLFVDAAGRD